MKTFFVSLICLGSMYTYGNDTLTIDTQFVAEDYILLWEAYRDSIDQTLVYESGTVLLKDGLAEIQVPFNFKYLNGEDSEMILTDLWGNPPSDDPDKSLGMLIPANVSPLDDSTFAINITYSEEGYIDDDDAKDLDYDELLESMQADAVEWNKIRVEQGYEEVDLVGWASPPFYDAESKKLHWAKELNFGGAPTNTLNYNIRILGRRGYLQLNAISEMYLLNEVKQSIEPVLGSVEFTDGHRYADFNPSMDKVAAYGIGGLIAGKVFVKAGLFAKLGILLAKSWKIIAVAFIALAAFFKRLVGQRNQGSDPRI